MATPHYLPTRDEFTMAQAKRKKTMDVGTAEVVVEDLPERLLTAIRNYRKVYRKGSPDKLDEAHQLATEARREVAATANDPTAQDEAIKTLRKANQRIDRLVNRRGTLREAKRDALKNIQTLLDEAFNEVDA